MHIRSNNPIRTTVFFVAALLVGFGVNALLSSSAASATLEPTRPFVMEFRERSFNGAETTSRLDYRSEREWTLEVIEGGEDVGYYMRSRADGSVTAGYPDWDEPHTLAAPSNDITLPAVYFATRILPAPDKAGVSVASLSDANLAVGVTESIDRARRRGGVAVNDVVVIQTSHEIGAYSRSLGLPLWLAFEGEDAAYFEVLTLELPS